MNMRSLAVAVSLTVAAAQSASSQGPLTPPGPPGATMKSLDELDAKLNQANTKLDGVDAKQNAIEAKAEKRIPLEPGSVPSTENYHFNITSPGSYYLTGNLAVTKTHGIRINAEGVTLDLNGFQISRASGAGGHGIEITGISHRATVRDGSIHGFARGIERLTTGTTFPKASAFRNLAVSGCTEIAIAAGLGAVLDSCRVHGNTGTRGISAEEGSTLVNCTAFDNEVSEAIYAASGSTLTNCTAARNRCRAGISTDFGSTLTNCAALVNTGSTSFSSGIKVQGNSTIVNCVSSENTTTATPTAATGIGFELSTGNTIRNCTANLNSGDGIRFFADNQVRDNTCDSNGAGGDGAGIFANGADNRIDSNTVTDGPRGIQASQPACLIIRNSVSGSGTNYLIGPGHKVGVIVAAPDSALINGNTGGAGVGTTDPWANFSF